MQGKRRNCMYSVGDFIVHPGQGVCRVEAIDTSDTPTYHLMPTHGRNPISSSIPWRQRTICVRWSLQKRPTALSTTSARWSSTRSLTALPFLKRSISKRLSATVPAKTWCASPKPSVAVSKMPSPPIKRPRSSTSASTKRLRSAPSLSFLAHWTNLPIR